MKQYTYKTWGTCCKAISFELDDNDIVYNVKFFGGCAGNTIGVAKLCQGRSKAELIGILSGIKCGYKPTSCPDQLATALKQVE